MATKRNERIRICHMIAGMVRGGLETWLMNVMRRIDRDRYQFCFCTVTDQHCDYDEEIRDLGGQIYPCLWTPRRLRTVGNYRRQFLRLLAHQRFDVVHAHAYNFAGVHLRWAAQSGVQQRLAHLHTTSDGRRNTLGRILYRKLMVHWIRQYATDVIGCSRISFDRFFGPGWDNDPRMRVIYYGIELSPFEAPADRDGVRREFGLSAKTPLLIHVGRIVEPKNHRGLIDLFRVVHQQRPDVHLLLAGDGHLLPAVKEQVKKYGLEQVVHMPGVRSDVARLMKAADLMVMPSIWEGMPVTLLEATAAGLPVVMSDLPGVREANAICCNATILSPEQPPVVWAQAVLEALSQAKPDADEALNRVRSSPFSDAASAQMIAEVYEQCLVN